MSFLQNSLEHSLKQHPEDTRAIQFHPYQEWLLPSRTNFLALQNLGRAGTSSLMPSPLLDYDQLPQLVGLPYTQWVSMEPVLVAFSTTTHLMQQCTHIDFYMWKPLTGQCVHSPQSRKLSDYGNGWSFLPFSFLLQAFDQVLEQKPGISGHTSCLFKRSLHLLLSFF